MALVILAHPHFDQSIANKAIIEELSRSDIDFEIRNLSALYPTFQINVKAEQEAYASIKRLSFNILFIGIICQRYSSIGLMRFSLISLLMVHKEISSKGNILSQVLPLGHPKVNITLWENTISKYTSSVRT